MQQPSTGGQHCDVDACGCAGKRKARAAKCTWLQNNNGALAATVGGLGMEVASLRQRVRETKAARGAEASEGRDDLLAENGALGQIS